VPAAAAPVAANAAVVAAAAQKHTLKNQLEDIY